MLEYTSAISPPPRKQRPARLVAAAARVAVATVLSVVNCTNSGFSSLEPVRGSLVHKSHKLSIFIQAGFNSDLYTSSQSGS